MYFLGTWILRTLGIQGFLRQMEHLSVDLKISYLGAIYLLRHIGGGRGRVSQICRNMTGGGEGLAKYDVI